MDTNSYWRERSEAPNDLSDTGLWELSDPIDGVMEGTWRNPKTGKSFPIRLTLVDGNSYQEPACTRDSYNLPLEKPPKVEKGKIIQFSLGRSYRKLRFTGEETIELFGPDPALGRINSQLRPSQSKEAIEMYFAYRREALGRDGYLAVNEVNTAPVYWNSSFITIRFFLWTASEGRRGMFDDYRTWNTQTGEEVDLWQWFRWNSNELSEKLEKLLDRDAKNDPECEDYRGKGSYTILLDKAGLNIYEDPWGSGCEKEFFVPYEKLYPLLTHAGKKAVDSIIRSSAP
jgi:hypothetical protein